MNADGALAAAVPDACAKHCIGFDPFPDDLIHLEHFVFEGES